MTGMGGHHLPVFEKDEWLTPPSIIDALGGPASFDLDPCAPIERPWPMARNHWTKLDNGLLMHWEGRLWFNPPYGGPSIVGPWMRRMASHGRGTALIFARTETELFHETVWNAATAVFFFRGRLFFHHADGRRADNNAGAPSCLVAYGLEDAAKLESSAPGLRGKFLWLRQGEVALNP
jgi:hypothetical protein